MADASFDFGMIGLGTMGCNLLLNMADKGFAVTGFDLNPEKVKSLEEVATKGTTVKGATTLQQMVQLLKKPRKIMMLVPAGKPVDSVIESLLPFIEEGDIVIDGGNSHYTDTVKRIEYLQAKKIHFIGMGVSGGESGARYGPSMMPGGDEPAYNYLKPILEAIAAKVNGDPCVAYMGNGAAGHYVKMVHNGIEYAIMQLISEVYDILKRGAGFDNSELHELFARWNRSDLQSFLLEITADIFTTEDETTGKLVVDIISDKAGSKGTGKWTSQDAMDLGIPVPAIDMAVAFREISAYKDDRIKAQGLYAPKIKSLAAQRERLTRDLHDALYCATIICYAQGLSQLAAASSELKMNIPLKQVVSIWRGGCIIRSELLQIFAAIYKKEPNLTNILLHKKIVSLVKRRRGALSRIVQKAAGSAIPAPGMMSCLAYLDALCSGQMPTNLIQAQRDYFGAHTYQRIDKEGTFHTIWEK